MLSVPLLLVAIIFIVFFSIIFLIVHNEFNENEFNNRLKVLLEYVARTNADHPTPDTLWYVSDVNEHEYTVTEFSTRDMTALSFATYDDRVQTFNFLEQRFDINEHAQNEIRIAPHPYENSKFRMRGDDGWMDVDCPPHEQFDNATLACRPVPPCNDKTPGNYPLTETLIDTLILNHRVLRRDDEVDDDNSQRQQNYHPIMYLQCFEGGAHAVQECVDNYLFDSVSRICKPRNYCENRPDDFVLDHFPDYLLINEYIVCQNGESVVHSCPSPQIFDKRLMRCVDTHPCAVSGAGDTYITDYIQPNQYYRCVSRSEAELVTCIIRVFRNNEYGCGGDPRCSQFDNGTGLQFNTYTSDTIDFDTGAFECRDHEIARETVCDTDNMIADRVYSHRLLPQLHLPRQTYSRALDACLPYDRANVHFKNPYYSFVTKVNDIEIDLETSLVGNVDTCDRLLTQTHLDNDMVKYARDIDSVAIDAQSGLGVECFTSSIYDALYARYINYCNADHQLILKNNLVARQFIRPSLRGIATDIDYDLDCTIPARHNYIDFDDFFVNKKTHILQFSVCATVLNQIHTSYTTFGRKYTTMDGSYTFKSVKPLFYINSKVLNTHRNKNEIEIENNVDNGVATNASRNAAKTQTVFENIPKIEMKYIGKNLRKLNMPKTQDKNQTIEPLFNPFNQTSALTPLFDPFVKENNDAVQEERFDNLVDETIVDNDGSDDDTEMATPPSPLYSHSNVSSPPPSPSISSVSSHSPSPPSTPPVPELILNEQNVRFLCMYSIPTYKMVACGIENDHIENELRRLRSQIFVAPECADAAGLANIFNAAAYLGNGVTCQSVFNAYTGIRVVRALSPVYLDVATQSDDGHKYNRFVHHKDGKFIACPEELLTEDFDCNIADDKVYSLANMSHNPL
ncbi:vp91 [Lambdina fiscellaria nucleopolyhedrovirus]|uniref:Vp91 n=1 Tax=Lambdina fiscellaria nucleopolyhedrovirus TaxID=1642929 RepID=A0A0E3URR0_9ABAC|nr:vp91 [Lambdina fiscellaria nucleopolyhedrovirus]AKC91689.1 vp91 [Lambdina fiscellaria nucleopolyhedrovirus]